MVLKDYTYDELLNILASIHTQPAFDNLKEYIDSNRSKFSPDEYARLQDMVRSRERYFNPKNCNSINEIRLYYRDNEGHEFSTAYSGEKGKALCREANDTGMTLSQYINFLGAGSNNGYTFQGWTIDASGNHSHAPQPASEVRIQRMPQEQEEQYYSGRKLRRGIREEERERREETLQIDLVDIVNRLKSELTELINESRVENKERISQLQNEINRLAHSENVIAHEEVEETEEEPPEYPKTLSHTLNSQQYLFFMRNAPALHSPIKVTKPSKGNYTLTVEVDNAVMEDRANRLFEEAERRYTGTSTTRKEHHPDHARVLDDLCKVYVKESGIPCGLSRTGALSSLADRLIDYAKSVGSEWDVLYDLQSINLFAKKGQIYTREQADEAFNNIVSEITGKGIGNHAETSYDANLAREEAIAEFMVNFDAISYIKVHNPEIPKQEYEYDLNRAIHELTEYHIYPNGLDDGRRIANSFLETTNGLSFNDAVKYRIRDIIDAYSRKNERDYYED